MKYIILGKSDGFDATRNNDSDSVGQYWELGAEIGIGRNIIVSELYNNNINDNDTTIVTIKDRMFLYQDIFKNVISYDEFLSLNIDRNFVNATLISPHLYNIATNNIVNKEDILLTNLLLKVKTTNILEPNKNFYIIHYRERLRGDDRNIKNTDYDNIINKLIDLGYDFFIYGKNSSNIASKYGKTELTLSEAVSYMKLEKCFGFVGPLSGGSMIALLSCKSTHHILDVANQNNETTENNHLFHNDKNNFINSKIINHKNVESFLNILN